MDSQRKNNPTFHFVWTAGLRTKRQLKIIQELLHYNNNILCYYPERDFPSNSIDSLRNKNITFIKIPGLKSIGQGYKSIFDKLIYGYNLRRMLKRRLKKGDKVFVTDYDSAIFLLGLRKIKLYFDIADYVETFDSKWPLILRKLIRLSYRLIYHEAELIIIPDKNRIDLIPNKFHQNVRIINNAPRLNKYKVKPEIKRDGALLNLFYYGGLSKDRGLDFLIKLSETTNLNIKIHVAGWGQLENEILESKSIQFYGMLSEDEVLSLLQKMDYTYVFYDPSFEHNRMASPNKLFEAIHFEVPLIVAENTYIDKIVHKYNIGEVCSYDFASLQNLITKIIMESPKYSFRNLDKQGFSWDNSKSAIKEIFHENTYSDL